MATRVVGVALMALPVLAFLIGAAFLLDPQEQLKLALMLGVICAAVACLIGGYLLWARSWRRG